MFYVAKKDYVTLFETLSIFATLAKTYESFDVALSTFLFGVSVSIKHQYHVFVASNRVIIFAPWIRATCFCKTSFAGVIQSGCSSLAARKNDQNLPTGSHHLPLPKDGQNLHDLGHHRFLGTVFFPQVVFQKSYDSNSWSR